jgi:periplasmic divalent cation tolerance protein
MLDTVTLTMTTLPDAQAAGQMADRVLEAGLAACVTELGSVRSRYRWQGKLEDSVEVALLFKTAPLQLAALEKFIAQHHPYEVPEIVSWNASSTPGYAQWVATETSRPVHV